jgi:putative glutamine amidotransferase
MRPRIGITVSEYHEFQGFKLKNTYSQAIEKAGGLPFLLPISEKVLIDEYIENIDGLLLSGGGDFAPKHFGAKPVPVECIFEYQRDVFELDLIRAAWLAKKPILAICRGMQGLNIALGGSIYQDLEYANFYQIDHRQKNSMREGSHQVMVNDDSLIKVFGQILLVNSSHHQAVKDVAAQLVSAATSTDGIIEAIIAKDKSRYAVGVQWHPEVLLPTSGIFSDFVEYIKISKN